MFHRMFQRPPTPEEIAASEVVVQRHQKDFVKSSQKMKISKHCRRLRDAEDHQDWLYEKYSHVRLLDFPRSEESGMYVWEVQ